MHSQFEFDIKYSGGRDASENSIDLYDLSVSQMAFHRSLLIVTNFVITGNIVTKAPYIKDLRIITTPSTVGSYNLKSSLLFLSATLVAPFWGAVDTPIGNIAWSVYDYTVEKVIGIQANPQKSLYARYLEKETQKDLEPRISSLAQKIEPAVIDIHRPIATGSAESTLISARTVESNLHFNMGTYSAINDVLIDVEAIQFLGRVAGYNVNTENGMIFIENENRAIPFEIDNSKPINTQIFLESLSKYNEVKKSQKSSDSGFFFFSAKRMKNRSGEIKKVIVVEVFENTFKNSRFQVQSATPSPWVLASSKKTS